MPQAIASPRHAWWPTAAVAILLPAAFVAVDHLLLDAVSGAFRTDWIMVITMAVFVAQIGFMGFACARWIDWPLLRCVLYAWCWLLIDFQTLIAWMLAGLNWWGDAFHASALYAGQLGLIVIWAFLGTSRWTIRLPLAFVPAAAILLALIRFRYSAENAALLFVVEIVALAAICARLRWLGYRVIALPALPLADRFTPSSQALQTSQFQLRDILMWTTAFAIVCGIVRLIGIPLEQWLQPRFYRWSPVVFVFTGGAVAMALLIALWAALGAGDARWRAGVTLLVVPAIAAAAGLVEWLIWLLEYRPWTGPWARGKPVWIWLNWDSYYFNERHLIAWICLASAMLFATLLFPRALGCRLARPEKSHALGSENATSID